MIGRYHRPMVSPPRFALFDAPSPLHPLPRFCAALGGRVELWVKREDLLPVAFGGPLRLRVPRQLGYKSVKFVNRLMVTDSLKGFVAALDPKSPNFGYSWYAGI